MSLGIFDGHRSLGRAPSPQWPDERVKTAQALLNQQMAAYGCGVKLTVDGLIGPKTCGAIAWVSAAEASGGKAMDPALRSLLDANKADFSSACASTGATQPACALPKPPAPAVTVVTAGPSSDDVLVMQSLINDEVLKKRGYTLVPETGKLDPLTCGAASGIYADARAGLVSVSTELMRLLSLPSIPTACGPLKPWQQPSKATTVSPPPPPPPVQPPPPPQNGGGYEQCFMDYGVKSPAVAELQSLLNVRLKARGFRAIPVTGTYDAATCGAISALKDLYTEWSTKTCPGGLVVPISCTKTVAPQKAATPPPPPPPPPVVKKPKLGAATIGLAAVVMAGGALYAKKKGLFG